MTRASNSLFLLTALGCVSAVCNRQSRLAGFTAVLRNPTSKVFRKPLSPPWAVFCHSALTRSPSLTALTSEPSSLPQTEERTRRPVPRRGPYLHVVPGSLSSAPDAALQPQQGAQGPVLCVCTQPCAHIANLDGREGRMDQ